MRRFLMLLLISVTVSHAASQDLRIDAALRDARTLIGHMQDFDTDGVAALLYTAPLERLGADPAQLKQQTAQLNADLRSLGTRYERFVLGKPTKPFLRPEGLFSLIPYSCVIAANGQKVQQDAFFVAFSADAGKTWKFLDGIATRRAPIDVILPNYEGPELPPVRRFPVP
jgi:hypothetical protein